MPNSAKYFETLYDNLHFPINVINEEGKIIFINKSFSIQWGYSFSELKEYNVFNDSELKRNGIASKLSLILSSNEVITVNDYFDTLLKSREITPPILKTKIFPVKLNDKNYIVFFHEDRTEIYLTEEEVKKARDANKEAERLKDTFLNVLSHELRTPLNIVLGYASIIKESLKDKINTEDKVYLDNLYSGSERLFKSITQMLEFAQIEAGNFKLKIETVELVSVIQNCIYGIKETAQEKNIDIKTLFDTSSVYVDVDIHCLENALNNLLNNAVKFTKQGFIEIETAVIKDREIAIIKIKDTGIGISTEYMDHLYRPFSQEDLNISRNYEGNGLGLALAKRYLEKMGGSLLVDSIKGVGSTFTFTLPLAPTMLKSEKAPEKTDGVEKILMLDDSYDSYELLKAFLKSKFTIDVYNFRDFKIDLVNDKDYKVIIFDVNQSHWNQSLIICKELKENDPFKRSVIVISSEFDEDKIEEFYAAGADKFLIKPFSKKDLVNILEEVLA